ncbi:MAG TPA: cobyrinate a,c-diamide synthase [Acidimicrobiales bacterium]|nr:cobyrinate a,c-diamide synthase [Acidimicrobiales bacterium]
MALLGPRLVVAGTHSGVGKTTVATGIMAALASRGLRVGAAKVGPDFIDPGYHRAATGRPGRSLDAFLAGRELLPGLAAAAARGADLLVVEGVMGLFDGAGLPGVDGSTAEVSRVLEAPTVLVVDASAMSGSVAALVHGYASYDPSLDVAGVVLNRVGGAGHAELLREALAPLGLPVLGAIPRRDDLVWRERHLGLVPVAERPAETQAAIARLGEVVARHVDLEALLRLARAAPTRRAVDPPSASFVGRCVVALCAGPAFSFVYPENLELLEQAGAELVPFDPCRAARLPDGAAALYAGGGFPEVFASELAANRPLLDELAARVSAGLVTWAECGGFLLLCESLDGVPLAGALAGVRARLGDTLAIGYRRATTRVPGLLGPAGTELVGHEFHRSTVEPAGDALELEGRFGRGRAGFSSPTLFASYLHQHLAARPVLAQRFVRAALDSLPRRAARA